jgi:hypothetical protein
MTSRALELVELAARRFRSRPDVPFGARRKSVSAASPKRAFGAREGGAEAELWLAVGDPLTGSDFGGEAGVVWADVQGVVVGDRDGPAGAGVVGSVAADAGSQE